MSVHFSHCFILDVDKPHLAIRFTKDDDFRVFLPVLPECGDAVGGEIKRVGLFWGHGNSSPYAETSASRGGKDVVAVANEFVYVLKGLVYDFWVNHECLCFRVDD